MTKQTTNIRGIKIALASYLALLVLQLVVYFMTHTLVLLAMAFETLASILIATLLIVGASYSQKPADEFHMFGYGRAQNVAALVSGVIFISFMSLETFRQAIPKFSRALEASHFPNINLALIVTVISLLVVAIPLIDILRVKTKGASLKAQLVSSLEDMIAYVAGLIGIIFVARGYYLADPIASIIVAIFIALGGLHLFRENFPYLLGKAPSREFIEKVELTAKSVEGVLGVYDLKAEYVASHLVHTGFHIEVARGIPIEEADRIAHEIRERVSRETGCQHCVIQIHPADGSRK